jgi:hypothetical protein
MREIGAIIFFVVATALFFGTIYLVEGWVRAFVSKQKLRSQIKQPPKRQPF